MTVFYSFLPTTVHTGAPTHDGLGRAALVRRFKIILNRRTRYHIEQHAVGYVGNARSHEPRRWHHQSCVRRAEQRRNWHPMHTGSFRPLGLAEEELRGAYRSLYNGINVAWGAAPPV
jgi:hypothetical protein